MRTRVRLSSLLVLLLVTTGALFAQTNTLMIPVVVTSKSGTPTKGLQKQDFLIRNPKEASFESVAEVQSITSDNPAPSIPRPALLVFDAMATPPLAQGMVQKRLLALLGKMAEEHSRISLLVITRDGLQLIYDSNTDSAVLSSALDLLKNPKAGAEPVHRSQDDNFQRQVALQRERLNDLLQQSPGVGGFDRPYRQLGALRRLAEMFQNSASRKALMWITANFPVEVNEARGLLEVDTLEVPADLSLEYQRTVEALNAARMSVYPFQFEGSHQLDYTGTSGRTAGGLDMLAKATGGKTLSPSQDFYSALRQAVVDCDSYYLLTIRLPEEKKKVEWRKLKLSTTTKGVSVRFPPGFFQVR